LISWRSRHKEQQVSTQEEELETLKRFFKDYGLPIVVGLVLAIAVVAGWKVWQKTRLDNATQAATVFREMMSAVQRSQLNPEDKAANTEVQRLGKALKEDHAKTPFALNAGMLLARQAADRGDYKEAEKQLRWALEQKPGEAERILVTSRLARVLAAQAQYEPALALLNKEEDKGFRPTLEELKGDIYQAQGKLPEARKAYEAAALALQERDERRPLLELKMADVGLAPLEPKKKDEAAKQDDKSGQESKSS
jgi:predicted negative regulator of RcsB-dependent stress response